MVDLADRDGHENVDKSLAGEFHGVSELFSVDRECRLVGRRRERTADKARWSPRADQV
jgi:hypothetical protein